MSVQDSGGGDGQPHGTWSPDQEPSDATPERTKMVYASEVARRYAEGPFWKATVPYVPGLERSPWHDSLQVARKKTRFHHSKAKGRNVGTLRPLC